MADRWLDGRLWLRWRYWSFLSRFCRPIYDWHIDYGHPYEQPWPGEGGHWGPRHPWVCDLGDWLTAGWLHD